MPPEGRGGGGGVSPLVFVFSFSSQPCKCLLLRVPRTSTPLGGGLAKLPTGKRGGEGISSVHALEGLEVARLPGIRVHLHDSSASVSEGRCFGRYYVSVIAETLHSCFSEHARW